MGRLFFEIFIFATLLFYISCGGTLTNPNAATNNSDGTLISASEGGEVRSPDGKLLLSIPAGALNEDTVISIEMIASDEGNQGYEFKPDGLVFNQPAIAHLEMDISHMEDFEGEGDEKLDPKDVVPVIGLFLRSADGTFDIIDNIEVDTEAGDGKVMVRAPIPHFTSLIGSAGNSYYAYLTSLGTHYVGSSFKSDLDVRYLGYSTKKTFQNMSMEYTVRSVTVTKIKFETSGVIKILSPTEINRNAFLSKRGQTSSTRPKFICDEVGKGTVKASVTVSAIIDVTFQPENKTLTYSVNQIESTTRKGKCIARISSFFQNGSSGYEGGTLLAVANDPLQDLTYLDGEPTEGLELPGNSDFSEVALGLHEYGTLEVAFLLDSPVAASNPDHLQYLNFNVATLDEELGFEGSGPYAAVSNLISIEAIGPGGSFTSSVMQWDPELGSWQEEEIEIDTNFGETGISLLIPLEALGLHEDELAGNNLRLISLINMAAGYPYAGTLFTDTVDLEI